MEHVYTCSYYVLPEVNTQVVCGFKYTYNANVERMPTAIASSGLEVRGECPTQLQPILSLLVPLTVGSINGKRRETYIYLQHWSNYCGCRPFPPRIWSIDFFQFPI